MDYIVMDLEWNQGGDQAGASTETAEKLTFEVIEIGAVKLNDDGVITGKFHELIKPRVYHEMNRITGQLIHLQMEELEEGLPFQEAAEKFLQWCSESPHLFCTWGDQDLTELQRNMAFYHMTPMSCGPMVFLDVQKLFSLAFEDGKSRRSLGYAVDLMELEKDVPFHRAFGDAWYTAKLFAMIMKKNRELLQNVSYDLFHLPADRDQEVRVRFADYAKYISREFTGKREAFADREVLSSKCYLCRRNLKKKLKWFTPNGRHYYCLAYCEKHGYLKGKIRVRRSEGGGVYIVKTTKIISPEEAEEIRQRSLQAGKQYRGAARNQNP